MAANLPQPCECREDVDFALVEPLFFDGLHYLLATAAKLGQVQLALVVTELAIATLLDPFRQVLRHVLFKPAQEHRTQLGREPLASDALRRFRVFPAGFIGFGELFLIPKIPWLDGILNVPKA